MLPDKYLWVAREFEPEGDPWLLLAIARELENEGNLEGAATVYDRAYGIDPAMKEVRDGRARVLDQLAVEEHGILFRYVPAGPFLMGCEQGEHDEKPWHPVWLSPYWLSETPISWTMYCQLMDWEPPPASFPRGNQPSGEFDHARFHLREANKIRLQYCEDRTIQARDWHSHAPGQTWTSGGQVQTAQEVFGAPARDDPNAPWMYETKPMVAVGWQEALEAADRISTPKVRYTLPSEAQWEKAARGGLIGARYAWGNDRPTQDRCDFDRFYAFSIQPARTHPPNGYGLHAMNGCVWEWTRDWYDSDYYRQSAENDPEGPPKGEEKVLRGGSWADCAEVISVTFRMSRASSSWHEGNWGSHLAPNIGFRLCRMRLSS